jgi:hypothetical protein
VQGFEAASEGDTGYGNRLTNLWLTDCLELANSAIRALGPSDVPWWYFPGID